MQKRVASTVNVAAPWMGLRRLRMLHGVLEKRGANCVIGEYVRRACCATPSEMFQHDFQAKILEEQRDSAEIRVCRHPSSNTRKVTLVQAAIVIEVTRVVMIYQHVV